MNYYISDLHIGHANAIKFDGRPFVDVNEMNNAIIENWNSRVKTDDQMFLY
jgi:calcineurin-like phosphoesterase family protein